MTPAEVYRQAADLGLRLEQRGEKLAVIPANRCPPDFTDVLREHKPQLLAWLSRPPCPGWQAVPPADLPINPVLPRPTPEDRERVIAYLLRQTGDHPGPLAAWLVRRECAYFDGPGAKWDCALHAYAAARDAACWQLCRSERDVLELLSGFHECSNAPKSATP
jgi:hypothetical protein